MIYKLYWWESVVSVCVCVRVCAFVCVRVYERELEREKNMNTVITSDNKWQLRTYGENTFRFLSHSID